MKFPDKCPYCGKDIAPNRVLRQLSEEYSLCIELHNCIHCEETIVVIERYHETPMNNYFWEIIHVFPSSPAFDFPKRVKELSPNCYKAFEQTMSANSASLDLLVGTGLRIALEWLSWDYLIKIKNFTEKELKPLRLVDRLEKMNSSFYTDVCTKLIRKFGNDSAHIIKKLDFSVDEVINMFNILCTLINSELDILDAHERLNSTPETDTPPTDRKS